MPLIIPNSIENDTPADAAEIQQNFAATQTYVNSNLINRDGSVAMIQPLTLVGDPSQNNHASTKAYVDAILPIGVILPFGGVTAPAGRWALANGAALATATYPSLFSVFGYRYGGSGVSFNLPNFAAKVPVGVDATQERFDATGKTGGSYTMLVPAHAHTTAAHNHTMNHNHANVSITNEGAHQHTGRIIGMQSGTSGPTYTMAAAAAQTTGTTVANVTTSGGGLHDHTVITPNHLGSTANSVATATSTDGIAAAEHLPPYVVVQYIVRLD